MKIETDISHNPAKNAIPPAIVKERPLAYTGKIEKRGKLLGKTIIPGQKPDVGVVD
jgi:hypothetical protein